MRRTHRPPQLLQLPQQELDARQLVGPPPVVGQAGRRQAPLIAHVRIEIDRLVGVRQVVGLRDDCRVPREVLREEVAICRAPPRDARRRVHAHRCADRAALQVGGSDRDLRAADEAQAAVVEIVGVPVVQAVLLGVGPHVDVDESIVERGKHSRPDVGHQMLAHLAARVGQAVRELCRLGKQQQARVVVDERSENDELGFNRVV